ncbi:MAG: hypothetical protein ACI8WB_001616 [Phenylobacterium sp.]
MFKITKGIQGGEFNTPGFYKSDDGELFFGGLNGFNRFYPQDIKDNTRVPNVVLTDFLLANQSVSIDGEGATEGASKTSAGPFTLNKTIDNLDQLTLTHEQNLLTFEVGFSSHSYFTACFKAHFGCVPSVYVDEQKVL